MESGAIVVSSKTLGLISSGIYRSPASALKELISNAFDADATWVSVSMTPPNFDVVSVTDSGSGIERAKFLKLMKGQIGDSDKRNDGDRSPLLHRPLIGRIGIGLLAIVQICHGFEVISHHKASGTAFRARVQISDDTQDMIDKALLDPTETGTYKLDIGSFILNDIDFDETRGGTAIIATDLKYGFLRRMLRASDTMRDGDEGEETEIATKNGVGVLVNEVEALAESIVTEELPPLLPTTFDKFFSSVVKHKSIREVSEYWRTTWNIALAAPLPYYDDGPVRGHPVNIARQKELESFDFAVVVDGLPLRRPVLLPPRPADQRSPRDMHVEILTIDSLVDGTRLRGQGYIYSQGGKSIYPAELRGMLIRIKGVAIGEYDRSFLDYPIVEGPRYSWLSGEIDIEEGLEDALNIDRDSFNQAHPHFLEVQSLIHLALDRHVRPWLYRNLTVRKNARTEEATVTRQQRLNETVARFLPDAHVERVSISSPHSQNRFVSPVRIDDADASIEVNESAPLTHEKRNRDLGQEIAIGFELALRAPTLDEVRRQFYEYLRTIL